MHAGVFEGGETAVTSKRCGRWYLVTSKVRYDDARKHATVPVFLASANTKSEANNSKSRANTSGKMRYNKVKYKAGIGRAGHDVNRFTAPATSLATPLSL
jgi:putative salt-induced outer membrane protein YdiY